MSVVSWLTDSVIHAAQLLIKNDHTLLPLGSLQNPIHGQTLTFDGAPEESVQILNSGNCHWLTISTVGVEHPKVRVYDSLYRVLPFETCEQVATLLCTKKREIELEFRNIQVGYNYNYYLQVMEIFSTFFRNNKMDRIVEFLP